MNDGSANQKCVDDYISNELEKIFKASSERKYYIRTMQDYYILWLLVSSLNREMVKHHRINIKKEITAFFEYFKNSQ